MCIVIEGKVLMNEGGALPETCADGIGVRRADDREDVVGCQGWFQLSIGFFDDGRAGDASPFLLLLALIDWLVSHLAGFEDGAVPVRRGARVR